MAWGLLFSGAAEKGNGKPDEEGREGEAGKVTRPTDAKSSWTKQCGHCLHLLGEDGQYHDRGLTAAVASIPSEKLRVFSSICPDCFDSLRESLSGQERGPGRIHTAVA